jgi:hypothetical protein
MQALSKIRQMHKEMVMVGEHAPGMCLIGVRLERLQQDFAELPHPIQGHTHQRSVLIAGSRDVKAPFGMGCVRRPVPWMLAFFAPLKKSRLLFLSKLSPAIHVQWKGSLVCRAPFSAF